MKIAARLPDPKQMLVLQPVVASKVFPTAIGRHDHYPLRRIHSIAIYKLSATAFVRRRKLQLAS